MDRLLYFLGLALVRTFQAMPLSVVALIGRTGGGIVYWLDGRHRRVAIENLSAAFPDKSAAEIRGLARENFKRIGENYCGAVKTAAMGCESLRSRIEFVGVQKLHASKPTSRIFAIGHFGNFELYARGNLVLPEFQFATTYRALNQPGLNQLLQELRQRSGCLLFERRTENDALRAAVRSQPLILGFLSDQHAGRSGAWIPFFGRLCSTTTAPAVFALRYKLPLYTAICYRIALGRWRIEVGREIPTTLNGQRRPVKEIMLDVNREFEAAIRRDPANWFWVHKRWKPIPANMQTPLTPAPLKILVRGVNWLGDAVMALPALERLREAHPAARITLLTYEKLAELWPLHPAIDNVLTVSGAESIFSISGRLRAEQFDLALVLPNSPRSALEVFLARIPRRAGYARPWRNMFLTQAVPPRPGATRIRPRSVREIKRAIHGLPPALGLAHGITDPQAHHIFDYLHLAAALGAKPLPTAPRLMVGAEEIDGVKTLLPLEAPQGGWFGLNPGAEYGPAKRWPAERFIEAAIEIHRHNGCGWLIFGGVSDVPLASEIAHSIQRQCAAPVLNLAGQTTLRQLCAAFKLCRVLLTNDTGPMHLAAAVGTPVVVPFGSTSPELTGPGLPGTERHALLKANVPCSPCFRRTCPIDFRCMQSITVDQVVSAVLRME